MSENPNRMDHATIKLSGSPLDQTAMDQLIDIVVDLSLDVPGMFICRFHDDKFEIVDKFRLGSPVQIEFSKPLEQDDAQAQYVKVIDGEVTAIETDFGGAADNDIILTIRGYDKSHRLQRETKSKTWLNIKDSDIAQQIASTAGLSAQVQATSEVFKHIYQDALTDMEFLKQRASRIGYEVFVEDNKLYFRKPDPTGSPVDLEWGVDLLTFSPRLTIANQANEVIVRGWDPKAKKAIEGQATRSKTAPQIQESSWEWGGKAAQQAISTAKKIEVRQPVQSKADADAIATAILNSLNSEFVEAEGQTVEGLPALKAGGLVNIKKVGPRFSGKYKLTSVRHIYDANGYVTEFAVEGAVPEFIAHLVSSQNGSNGGNRWSGVVTAVVTNNNCTEEDWGRIKVKFPWLDDTQESYWARLVGPGMGAERGIYFMPEVNDEVLVAFEQGDFNRPYVIGGLYNGKDKPAEAVGTTIASGKVKTRVIKTRTGHLIRFTDEQAGGKIEIIDAKQENKVIMDTANKKIDVTSTGDVTVDAQGNIKLKAQRDIALEATGKIDIKATQGLTLQGQTMDMTAQSNGTFQANGNMTIKGMAVSVQGQGQTQVTASGDLSLRGAMVRIN